MKALMTKSLQNHKIGRQRSFVLRCPQLPNWQALDLKGSASSKFQKRRPNMWTIGQDRADHASGAADKLKAARSTVALES